MIKVKRIQVIVFQYQSKHNTQHGHRNLCGTTKTFDKALVLSPDFCNLSILYRSRRKTTRTDIESASLHLC